MIGNVCCGPCLLTNQSTAIFLDILLVRLANLLIAIRIIDYHTVYSRTNDNMISYPILYSPDSVLKIEREVLFQNSVMFAEVDDIIM